MRKLIAVPFILLACIACFFSISSLSHSALVGDPRYCGPPARNESGTIIRSTWMRDTFKKIHPCPSTGLTSGACPGWQIDHVLPLASCGCDTLGNLQWLPVEIKTCAGIYCKDRWERTVYTCEQGGY